MYSFNLFLSLFFISLKRAFKKQRSLNG
jgi:hypothetical protein